MKENVAYIVSMVNGLEAFIHREIKELLDKGLNIELFITKYTPDPIYGPKIACWVYHKIRLIDAISAFINTVKISILMPNVLTKAIKYNVILEYIIACHFSSLMKKRKISHIHCHFGDRKLFVGYFCDLILNLGLSVTIHSHEIHHNINPEFFEIALKRCQKIFAISEYAKKKLISSYGSPIERTIVNRLFVNSAFNTANARPLTVLTVGRFDEIKGHKYLFEAAAILKNENIQFVVVGSGPLDVKHLVNTMGLADKVRIFNRMDQSQLSFFYQQADIFCLPSIEVPERGVEGIPVVLIEAMAFGLPVISTSTGGIPELVTSTLVPPQDSGAIADAIRILAASPNRRKEEGTVNSKIIAENYSTNNLIEHMKLFKLENDEKENIMVSAK